ncbi:MAG: acyl carrier protein [Planctomycetes bacterium]|nr:acyl carrier protein [Planctomycetota bacterium]
MKKTLSEKEVIALTNRVLAESFEIEEERLLPEKRIFADLGLDSLDTVDLVVALQKRFSITIREDERVRSIRSLGDLYTYIMTVQQEQQAGTEG